VETASHEDEPAGKPLSAFGQWNRDKIVSAARAGVYPVDENGRTSIPDWLANMLDQPAEGDAEQ
jgi:hypothetical protein